MLKCELEKKLNKTLTNQEYTAYIMAEYKAKKYGNKKQVQNTTNFTFIDAKEEFLATRKEQDQSYYKKEYEYVLKFGENFLLFRKPTIETRFCFGYGCNGISTTEEMDRAYKEQDNANSNEKYFLNENLAGLNQQIEEMEILTMDNQKMIDYCNKKYQETYRSFYNHLATGTKVYLFKHYDNTLYIQFIDAYNENRINTSEAVKELTKDELKTILAVYQQQKKNFEKRLQTYLKRYGLSKLHTWTYLVD